VEILFIDGSVVVSVLLEIAKESLLEFFSGHSHELVLSINNIFLSSVFALYELIVSGKYSGSVPSNIRVIIFDSVFSLPCFESIKDFLAI